MMVLSRAIKPALFSQFTGGIQTIGLGLDAEAKQIFHGVLERQFKLLVAHIA